MVGVVRAAEWLGFEGGGCGKVFIYYYYLSIYYWALRKEGVGRYLSNIIIIYL